jgi:aminoglycoside 6'-N-acetyltransferase I
VTDITLLADGDDATLASVADGVFDNAVRLELVTQFLADPRHHIAVATDDGVIVGFASAVHYVHPDKVQELWINEVGVAATHRKQGLARELLSALFERGRELGCVEAWVLTERANGPAARLYTSVGRVESEDDTVMFSFDLSSSKGDS